MIAPTEKKEIKWVTILAKLFEKLCKLGLGKF
jgi:hypothetical protein